MRESAANIRGSTRRDTACGVGVRPDTVRLWLRAVVLERFLAASCIGESFAADLVL